MTVETVTLGCRLNFAEGETIAALAPAGEEWVVVNSCAVTNEAVRQTRQAIRRAHRRRPEARILVTGCAAELEPAAFAAMAGVARVVGNSGKLHAFSSTPARPEPVEGRSGMDGAGTVLRQAQGERIWLGDRVELGERVGLGGDVMASPLVAAGMLHKVKSFVAVQTGCDHRCTFCTIWQARGASVSLPFEAIRDAITREIDRGAREIVLTGVDITDYEGGLGRLCQRLLAAEPRLQRLRLSSLDGVEMDDALFELIAGEPRLMPHFHLSLQAGDDMILKRMKRRHSRANAVRTVERIKTARADASIGADLIAGFPTETEDMAANTLKLIADCEIVAAHVFPFSARRNTPAARMPQLPGQVVKARAARLRSAAAKQRSRWLDSQIGSVQAVLIEGDGTGHSDNFAPVALAGGIRGQTGLAHLIGRNGDKLAAEWA